VLTVRDRRRFPAPGLLVRVDGRQIHLQVRAAESHGPTVVLEAGMGSFSPNWYWVQEELAPVVRSVSYDRAGLGWSRGSPRPRDAQTIAMELRDALREAAIEPPYVLAGHSFGGLPVRAFADLYPELTAGLVLVDASHPDQWVRWPTPHADKILEVSQRIFGWLGWFGVLRALNLARGISAGLPARQAAELRAGAALPGFAATEAAQIHSWSVSREQLNAAEPLGGLPLAVLAVSWWRAADLSTAGTGGADRRRQLRDRARCQSRVTDLQSRVRPGRREHDPRGSAGGHRSSLKS
jgi:pimeloyl-ACP methyl ester carboxylesterase